MQTFFPFCQLSPLVLKTDNYGFRADASKLRDPGRETGQQVVR